MSKLSDLKPFHSPTPPPKAACKACDAFAPTCLVPVGELAVPMCWLCAHHVIEHDCALSETVDAKCQCTPQQIYPGRAPAPREDEPKDTTKTPRELEREALLKLSPEKLAAFAREAHKQMSNAQLESVKKRLN